MNEDFANEPNSQNSDQQQGEQEQGQGQSGQPEQQQPSPSYQTYGAHNQAAPPPPPPGGYYTPQYPPRGQQPPPPRDRKFNWWIPASFAAGCLIWPIIGIIGMIIMAITIGSVGGGMGAASSGRSYRGDHIALIRVSGIITAGRSGSGGIFGSAVSGSEDIVSLLEDARKNSDVQAIVIRINSPGGSPSGSEEVWNEIQRVRKSGKPVYVSMADVAASGGYYIASPADRIFADDSTLTGSIGVIFDGADMSGLYKKIGINPEVIKSGKFKDIGSSARPMTPEERQLLQGIVDSTFQTFVKAVADGRKLPEAEVRKIADGRVFTGRQALKVKLVDEIGGLHETTRAAARAAGMTGEPKVVEYGRKGFFETLFGSESERANSELERQLGREMIKRMGAEDALQNLR